MSSHKKIKVGFDLDGVLLYNPARIIRPIIAQYKKKFVKTNHTRFIIPQSRFQKLVWSALHLSSMFIAPGYSDIKKLIQEYDIEAYIITARYNFLKNDFKRWKKRLETDKYFVQCHQNEQNEQPHLFKERMIKQLQLDFYIEDNWDIVNHLHNQLIKNVPLHSPLKKVYWVYNVLDRNIEYPNKVTGLKQFSQHLLNHLQDK